MDINQFVTNAQDAITVRRVFAEPYEKNGTTVITAARVAGGGGGGVGPVSTDGESEAAAGEGEGAGFGMNATPAGAFVIKDGDVRWVPAIDPARIFGAVAAVVIAVAVTRGWVAIRSAKACDCLPE